MKRYNFRERLITMPILWGIVTALAFTFIGHRPEKGVIPLVIALTFLCAFVSQKYVDQPRVRMVANVLSVVFAATTGWLAFKYPLPFS